MDLLDSALRVLREEDRQHDCNRGGQSPTLTSEDGASYCAGPKAEASSRREFESQTRIRIHRIRIRIPVSDGMEFRRLARLGYRVRGIAPYPQM
jgi:hypothetical protein